MAKTEMGEAWAELREAFVEAAGDETRRLVEVCQPAEHSFVFGICSTAACPDSRRTIGKSRGLALLSCRSRNCLHSVWTSSSDFVEREMHEGAVWTKAAVGYEDV
jgi:hypothetical protein